MCVYIYICIFKYQTGFFGWLLATCDSLDAHSGRRLPAVAPVPLGGNPLATRQHWTRAVFYLAKSSGAGH